jgi:hypothetical protein
VKMRFTMASTTLAAVVPALRAPDFHERPAAPGRAFDAGEFGIALLLGKTSYRRGEPAPRSGRAASWRSPCPPPWPRSSQVVASRPWLGQQSQLLRSEGVVRVTTGGADRGNRRVDNSDTGGSFFLGMGAPVQQQRARGDTRFAAIVSRLGFASCRPRWRHATQREPRASSTCARDAADCRRGGSGTCCGACRPAAGGTRSGTPNSACPIARSGCPCGAGRRRVRARSRDAIVGSPQRAARRASAD